MITEVWYSVHNGRGGRINSQPGVHARLMESRELAELDQVHFDDACGGLAGGSVGCFTLESEGPVTVHGLATVQDRIVEVKEKLMTTSRGDEELLFAQLEEHLVDLNLLPGGTQP